MGTTLSSNQVKIINLCDQLYWSRGTFPSVEKLALDLRLTKETIEKHLKSDEVQRALAARGIDFSFGAVEYQDASRLLTTDQILVANSLLNTADKRSVRQKLEERGVSTQEFSKWRNQKAFQEYMRSRARNAFGATEADAYLALSALVENQDLGAIKLFLEMQGIYTPSSKVTHEVNVNVIVTTVIEVLQKHLAPLPNGQVLLHDIAQDLELADLSGERRPQMERASLPGSDHSVVDVSALAL